MPDRIAEVKLAHRLRLGDRMQLLADCSSIPDVRSCGRVPTGPLEVRLSAGGPYFPNLSRCKRVHVCPRCSAYARQGRGQEIADLNSTWLQDGNSIQFFTMTASHNRDAHLADTIEGMEAAWTSVRESKLWRSERAELDIVGDIRVLEIRYGRNGWHPHFHGELFLRGTPDPEAFKEMKRRWARSAERVLIRHEMAPSYSNGWHWKPVTDPVHMAYYLTKPQDSVDPIDPTLTIGLIHRCRGLSVAPFELLDIMLNTGDEDAFQLWRQYEQTTIGKRITRTTSNLYRTVTGQTKGELSDSEVLDRRIDGEVLLELDESTANKLRYNPRLQAAFRNLYETDPSAALDLLASRGILYRAPDRATAAAG